MRKFTSVLIGCGVVTLLVGLSSPAHAAVNVVSDSWTVGGVTYALEVENSAGNVAYGASLQTPTVTPFAQSLQAIDFDIDAFSSPNNMVLCHGDTATVVTDAPTGDVTISCPAYEMSSGLWVTSELRLYNDQPLARSYFVFENRGTTDIDWSSGGSSLAYLYVGGNSGADFHQASAGNPTSCATPAAGENWAAWAGLSNMVTTGLSWGVAGNTEFDATGFDCAGGNWSSIYTSQLGVQAGQTLRYLSFVYTGTPASESSSDETTAFAATVSAMSMFDTFGADLQRGLPACTEITNFGITASADANPCPNGGGSGGGGSSGSGDSSQLPSTGSDVARAQLMGAGAGVVVLTGVALVVIRRRRNA